MAMHCVNMVVKFSITPMSTDININSANIITHSLQTVDWQALTHLTRGFLPQCLLTYLELFHIHRLIDIIEFHHTKMLSEQELQEICFKSHVDVALCCSPDGIMSEAPTEHSLKRPMGHCSSHQSLSA